MNIKNNNPVVTLKDVDFSYNGESVLENVDFRVDDKDFIWIVGPNGGGKTTLLKLIIGLLQPKQGKVEVFGHSPKKARPRIGYMTQHAELDLKFPVTALDIVLMGRLGVGKLFGLYSSQDKSAGEKALSEVGMADFRDRPFASLSGGQQRRLLVARALAGEPDLLILDEPTANLDLVIEKELYDLLEKLNQRLTIITVSHDPTFVSYFVKRVLCVNRQVHEHPTSEINGQFMGDIFEGARRMVRHDRHLEDSE